MAERNDFPSNSREPRMNNEKPKEAASAVKKDISKVVTGKAVRKKQTFGSKFKETFIGDDIKSVRDYVVWDVMVPAAKEMLNDMVGKGMAMILFGDVKKTSNMSRHRGNSTYTRYGSYSSGGSKNRERETSRVTRDRSRYEDPVLDDRGDAEVAFEEFMDLMIKYDQVTVGDLYSLVGISPAHTDWNYGWDDIEALDEYGAGVKRERTGYLIDLPRPILLRRR